MSNLLQFPADRASRAEFQPVRSVYTVREISRQFGLPESTLRRWARDGLLPNAKNSDPDEPLFDFRALQQFRRIRELRSRGASLQKIACELRGQLNLFPEAHPELIELPVRLSPFERGLLLFDCGDPAAADLFRRAVAESDCAPDAYCNLGIIEFEAGSLTKAFDAFTNALAADPRHFESHYNLANLYFEMGDYALAERHYQIAQTLEPSFPNLYFNLGLVHALRGDARAALAALGTYRTLVDEEEAARATNLIQRFEAAFALTE